MLRIQIRPGCVGVHPLRRLLTLRQARNPRGIFLNFFVEGIEDQQLWTEDVRSVVRLVIYVTAVHRVVILVLKELKSTKIVQIARTKC